MAESLPPPANQTSGLCARCLFLLDLHCFCGGTVICPIDKNTPACNISGKWGKEPPNYNVGNDA